MVSAVLPHQHQVFRGCGARGHICGKPGGAGSVGLLCPTKEPHPPRVLSLSFLTDLSVLGPPPSHFLAVALPFPPQPPGHSLAPVQESALRQQL